MSKFGRRIKRAPDGFDDILEPTLTALDNEVREKVNEPHEGLRKSESQWPVHQINWQRTRYVYDMYYTYSRISKEIYDYCIINKLVDAALIAKWKKPGYENLCSTYVINPRNFKFGTVSVCRVPKSQLAEGTVVEDATTGCRGCASGNAHNIFGNKYGQYLASIQIAREERQAAKRKRAEEMAAQEAEDDNSVNSDDAADDEAEEDDEDEDQGPVGAPDGSSGKTKAVNVWGGEDGMEDAASKEAALQTLQAETRGPPGKRSRPSA
jgi:bud site selection protein 31